LLLLSAAIVPVARAQDAARAVEDLERELVAAIAKTDLATYDRIVADDYVVVDATGRDIPKSEVIASYRSGTRRYTNLEIFDVRGRVFGDTAIVAARTKGLRREDGKDVPNDVRYVRVYARRDGRWRAVAQMSTPARPAS
jgi:ketosteroid isomerase-like protein